MRLFRRNHLVELDEAAAYARTLPEMTEVTIVKLPPRRPRDREVLASGDRLRRAFLDRLERRDHEEQEGKQP
jgi:hypothetical protein